MYFTLWVGGMFCLVGLVSLASARSNEEDRQPSISIVGGTQALEGEFPALGVIAADVDGTGTRPICAGTLITPSHLLTAAHCTKWHSDSTIDPPMVAFANNLDHPVKVFGILVKRIVHEHWDPLNYRNDIAIIVLKSPIKNIPLTKLPMASSVAKPAATTRRPTTRRPVTRRPVTRRPTTRRPTMKQPTKKQNVKPKAKARATRATRAFSSYANARAVIAGWGALAYGSSANSASLLLMKANVTIHDNSVCIQQFHGMNAFYPTEMLCASDPGRDTCQGDSGGPIYVNGTQVGITSWGLGCAESHYAGVYTRITNYVDWIAKTIAENKPKNVTHALNNQPKNDFQLRFD